MIHGQSVKNELIVAPAAVTAAGTNKVNIDTIESDYLTLSVLFSAEVNTDGVGPTLNLKHADVTDATSFVTITTEVAAHPLVSANMLRYDVDLRGLKRYIRIESTAATHTTNDLFTIAIIGALTRNKQEATDAAGRNVSTNDTVVTVTA